MEIVPDLNVTDP